MATAVVPRLFLNLFVHRSSFLTTQTPQKLRETWIWTKFPPESFFREHLVWSVSDFPGYFGIFLIFNSWLRLLQWNPQCFDRKVKGHILTPQTRCVTLNTQTCIFVQLSLVSQDVGVVPSNPGPGAGQQVAVHQEDTTVTTPNRPELESNPEPYCAEETTLTPPPVCV